MAEEFRLEPPKFGEKPGPETRQEAWNRVAGQRRAKMRARYGPPPTPAQTCRGCVHLKRQRHHDKTFYKCALFGDTRSDASDWRAKWPACGAWRKADAEI